MAKSLKIELIVDDKGSVVMKQFGGNAEKALGKVKTHAKAGAAQAGKMERAWEKSASHIQAHWKGYALAGGAALAATAYAIKRFADASVEEYKKYNTAVTDMGKITDETAESIKSKIGSIGPKYGDATELTKAYYNVISAGVSEPVAAMDTLKKSVKAAKAAHIESADTVMGITALMEAYGDKIKGASEAADLMFQIEASGKTTIKELIPYIGEHAGKSAALGISQDELGASFAQVTLLSGSTSNAATQYKAILTSLMAPSEAMTKLLGKYGGAQKAIADMGFEGVLKLIAEESGGNAAALQKLMGSAEAVGGTLTLLGNDMTGYSQRLADMKDKTGLAAKAFNDWEKSMEGIESTYDASVKNIMIAFGEEIAPLVASWMQLLIDLAPKIISAIHTAFDFISVSSISLIDQLMRGWIDIEYAFKTMVAGIEGAWNSGIDVLEEGFADFLDAVAAGLDKIPFFSDNATASMRKLADEVRANTSESEGFVASIMKVQAEKEKELAAHNKIIDAMMAEALGYKKTGAAAIKTEKKITKSLKAIGKDHVALTKAEIKGVEDTTKAAAKAAKEKEKLVANFSDEYQKLILGDYNYAIKKIEDQGTAYRIAGADHIKVQEWVSAEVGKLVSEEARAVKDYARESTKIYEQLSDDVRRLDLDDYDYKQQLLTQRYDNYRLHLESLAGQDQKYADGVKLLDTWLDAEKNKLWEDWASKHGSVLDRLEVDWGDYQREAIDANKIAYDAIAAGANELETQLSGWMRGMGVDWDNVWDTMKQTVTDAVAQIIVEAAKERVILFFKNAWDGDPSGKGPIETMIGIDVPFLSFAAGGQIPGIYNGKQGFAGDTVPIMATPGEYMVRREAAENPAVKSLLDLINQSGAGTGMIAAGKNIPALMMGVQGLNAGGVIAPNIGHYGWLSDFFGGFGDLFGGLWGAIQDLFGDIPWIISKIMTNFAGDDLGRIFTLLANTIVAIGTSGASLPWQVGAFGFSAGMSLATGAGLEQAFWNAAVASMFGGLGYVATSAAKGTELVKIFGEWTDVPTSSLTELGGGTYFQTPAGEFLPISGFPSNDLATYWSIASQGPANIIEDILSVSQRGWNDFAELLENPWEEMQGIGFDAYGWTQENWEALQNLPQSVWDGITNIPENAWEFMRGFNLPGAVLEHLPTMLSHMMLSTDTASGGDSLAAMGSTLGIAREGGIFHGPESGYPMELHGSEAVIPLKNEKVPVQILGSPDRPLSNNIIIPITVITPDGKVLQEQTIEMTFDELENRSSRGEIIIHAEGVA